MTGSDRNGFVLAVKFEEKEDVERKRSLGRVTYILTVTLHD